MENKVLIVDFGSQYTQLIARRIRELFIFCEIYPYNNLPKKLLDYKAVVFSGSPYSVYQEESPNIDLEKFLGKIPVLAICYGAQFIANNQKGKVENSNSREYGRARLTYIDNDSILFNGISKDNQVWMSHGDTIVELPEDAKLIASTESVENAAFSLNEKKVFGLQFHPEVFHTDNGLKIFENFFLHILKFNQDWTPKSFIQDSVEEIKTLAVSYTHLTLPTILLV